LVIFAAIMQASTSVSGPLAGRLVGVIHLFNAKSLAALAGYLSGPGLAGPDRAGAAAADPACPRDRLPAHQAQGAADPHKEVQAGPDRVRDQPLPGPVLYL
jgi:hypothetical protein